LRKVWVELLFSKAKERRRLQRFRLRELEKVTLQAQLIAAGQHLQRLPSEAGWGRRLRPNGAAGVVLPIAASLASAR